MTRYNCICFDCPRDGKFQIELESISKVTCPNCGSERTKILGESCGVFAKFSSMSPQDKQKALKKRSDEHFKKNLKEKKEYLDRSALGLAK